MNSKCTRETPYFICMGGGGVEFYPKNEVIGMKLTGV